MAIGKRKKDKQSVSALAVPQSAASTHPFSSLQGYNPRIGADMALYSSLREAIPIIDAAIYKLVRLIGSFTVECESRQATKELADFLRKVRVGAVGSGIDSFIAVFFEQLLTYGTAVGEIITDGVSITHLYNSELKSVALSSSRNPLEPVISTLTASGELVPVKYPQLILLSALNPQPGELYGTSLLKGLPFVSDILLKIYNTIGTNWERLGNVRFAVTYKPQGDTVDAAYAKQRAELVAGEWSKTMSSTGKPRDFVAVGDVSIRAIGSDVQILDSEVPVREMLEQIVAKLGIPPFLLGLSWSTTERMSSQQADILTSELEFYRRQLDSVIGRICELWLRLNGFYDSFEIRWEHITLQDITELSRSRYYEAQAERLTGQSGGETHDNAT